MCQTMTRLCAQLRVCVRACVLASECASVYVCVWVGVYVCVCVTLQLPYILHGFAKQVGCSHRSTHVINEGGVEAPIQLQRDPADGSIKVIDAKIPSRVCSHGCNSHNHHHHDSSNTEV